MMKNSNNDTLVDSKEEVFRFSDIAKQVNQQEEHLKKNNKNKQINWFYVSSAISGIIIISLWIINSNLSSALLTIKSACASSEVLYNNNNGLLKKYEEQLSIFISEREEYLNKINELNAQYETITKSLIDKGNELIELKQQNERYELKEIALLDKIKQVQEENEASNKNVKKRQQVY